MAGLHGIPGEPAGAARNNAAGLRGGWHPEGEVADAAVGHRGEKGGGHRGDESGW